MAVAFLALAAPPPPCSPRWHLPSLYSTCHYKVWSRSGGTYDSHHLSRYEYEEFENEMQPFQWNSVSCVGAERDAITLNNKRHVAELFLLENFFGNSERMAAEDGPCTYNAGDSGYAGPGPGGALALWLARDGEPWPGLLKDSVAAKVSFQKSCLDALDDGTIIEMKELMYSCLTEEMRKAGDPLTPMPIAFGHGRQRETMPAAHEETRRQLAADRVRQHEENERLVAMGKPRNFQISHASGLECLGFLSKSGVTFANLGPSLASSGYTSIIMLDMQLDKVHLGRFLICRQVRESGVPLSPP